MSAPELFSSASALRAAGALAESHAAYAGAIALQPRMAEAYINNGWVLSELDRQGEAIHSYRVGLQLRSWPGDTLAAARNNIGVLLRGLGRTAEAQIEWQAALAAKPDFSPAMDNLEQAAGAGATSQGESAQSFAQLINDANGHLGRGTLTEAAAFYREALPLRDPRVDGSAYVGLGAALHASRQLHEAAHVLSAGAKLNPASPGMMMNLAIVRTDLEQWKGAASAWRKALRLHPNDAQAYRAAFAPVKHAKGAAAALPLLEAAAKIDPTNWQHHYTHAHERLQEAYVAPKTNNLSQATGSVSISGSGAATTPPAATSPRALAAAADAREVDASLAATALAALRPLHRLPISLRMRYESATEPPWTRFGGRGIVGDAPPPLALADIWEAQAERRRRSAAAGRQRGLIVYKLGPKPSEIDHLRLSLRLLMRHHNLAFRYPILIAHDEALDRRIKEELSRIAEGASLRFARLRVELPSHLPPERVPETVLGFPVAYRHMIRWKVGQLWLMDEVRPFEYIWSLDTDAFLLGPITYDVFGWMAASNATYGYVDVNVETAEVAAGLGECVEGFLRAKRASHGLRPTTLGRFRSGRDAQGRATGRGPWDGSKFYTNFQVARRDFGASPLFRELFEHIDRDGGIYRHRWGADPILFLAVNTLLRDEQVVHFADVPYLHQHLVANLPTEASAELALPAEFVEAIGYQRSLEAEKGAAGARGVSTGGGSGTPAAANAADGSAAGGRALLFVTDASHAAAAADALSRWETPPRCGTDRHREGAEEARPNHPVLRIEVCAPSPLPAEDRKAIAQLMRSLPGHIAVAEELTLCSPDGSARGGAAAATDPQSSAFADPHAAAATLVQVASKLRPVGDRASSVAPPFRLLLACVDAADGRTMAAALAARMSGVSTLNVCDVPLSSDDGLLVVPAAAHHEIGATGPELLARLLGGAASSCAGEVEKAAN